jgi:DNA-binding transcriptional LysR family regulator
MDRLASMRAFVKVVETGSFVRGADKLGISTTSASRLVAELE